MLPPELVAGVVILLGQPQQGPSANVVKKVNKQPLKPEPPFELILVDVLYNRLRLTTAMQALQDGSGRRYLPLRQLCNALDFRVHVNPPKLSASGFLQAPTDRVELDARKGVFKCKGVPKSFDPALCFEKDGDLYVDAELFGQIAGLNFSWRLDKLELDVQSETALNIQAKAIERRSATLPERKQTPDLETINTPYRLWSVPSMDVQFHSATETGPDEHQRSSRLSVEGTGDLLYMSARYQVSAGSDGKPAARLTLSRDDPKAMLLGSLKARRIALGDLNFLPVSLLSRGRTGIGLSITNFPLPGEDERSLTQVEGMGIPGSQVELYRFNVLVGIARCDADGHYTFLDVALQTGPNEFRIVSVTPEGDVREEERTIYGDMTGPRPGQGRYRFSTGKVGPALFSADSYYGAAASRYETIAEYQWGLTSGSWVSATLADIRANGDDARYMGFGYHAWGGPMQWHLSAMASDSGGGAASAGIYRKVGNAAISLEHTRVTSDFDAGILPEIGVDATSITKLRLDGVAGMRRQPISYGLSLDRYDGSNPTTFLRARLSGGSGNLFFSNHVALRFTDAPLEASGLLQFRKRLDRSFLRFDLGYSFGSQVQIRSARAAIDKRISTDYRVQYGVEYDAVKAGALAAIGTLYRLIGPLAVGLHFSVDTDGAIKASLLVSAGVAGDDSFSNVAVTKPGSGDTGNVIVRVFLDKNISGKFDKGDVLLPGIGVKLGGRATAARTGAGGICNLQRLTPNQQVSVAVNENSLEDPCWTPAKPGVLVIPRPGNIVRVDFPIIEAAEIEGKVKGLDLSIYPGLSAQLISAKGQVEHTSVLDSNGVYVFSRVRPGDYRLRLTDVDGRKLGERHVTVSAAALMKGCDVQAVIRS